MKHIHIPMTENYFNSLQIFLWIHSRGPRPFIQVKYAIWFYYLSEIDKIAERLKKKSFNLSWKILKDHETHLLWYMNYSERTWQTLKYSFWKIWKEKFEKLGLIVSGIKFSGISIPQSLPRPC